MKLSLKTFLILIMGALLVSCAETESQQEFINKNSKLVRAMRLGQKEVTVEIIRVNPLIIPGDKIQRGRDYYIILPDTMAISKITYNNDYK